MPQLTLTYFDFHGGRGEPARLALAIGEIPFTDERLKFPEWAARKASTPYGSLPLLTVDGEVLAQSNTINRFVGRLAGLYPEDALEAARCDEVMDALEDLDQKLAPTMTLAEPEKRLAREALVAGPLPKGLAALAARLGGKDWFADGRLTVADLKAFVATRTLLSGRLDHIPTTLLAEVAPALVAHAERVGAVAGVRAWYARHGLG